MVQVPGSFCEANEADAFDRELTQLRAVEIWELLMVFQAASFAGGAHFFDGYFQILHEIRVPYGTWIVDCDPTSNKIYK
jgi:hypothetical protein